MMLIQKKVEELHSHKYGTFLLKYEYRDPRECPEPYENEWRWEARHASGNTVKFHLFYYDPYAAEEDAIRELFEMEELYAHESEQSLDVHRS